MYAEFKGRVQGLRILILMALLAGPGGVLAVPKIQEWTTPRGGRVLFVATDGLPLVDLRLVFDAGSARDGEQHGLATLTSTLLDTGAAGMNADQIAQRLESVGAVLGAGASRDMAYVSLRTLSHPEKRALALETLRAVVAHPSFAASDFERERNRLLLAIKQQGEDPGNVAEKAFMKAIYGDHPYAHAPEGTADSVSHLTAQDLKQFHEKTYTVRNATLALVGALSRAEAEAVADALFQELPEGAALDPIPNPEPKPAASTQKLSFPSAQTHVLAGALGLEVNDPDLFPLHVGNHILGGSGLVSKIMEEVREKRGFAYSAYSYFIPMRVKGPFEVGLQSQNAKAGEALDVAVRTLRDFIDQGPTDSELDAAKKNIIGGFVLRLDSNQKLVSEIANIGFFKRPLDYLDTYTQRVQAVTREEVKRAFKARIHPDQLQTVLVGGEAAPAP